MTKRAVLLFSSHPSFYIQEKKKKESKILTITSSIIGCKLLQNRVYREIRKEFSFFFFLFYHLHYDWPIDRNIRLVEPIPSFSVGRFLDMF
jgi:hypothetical protein